MLFKHFLLFLSLLALSFFPVSCQDDEDSSESDDDDDDATEDDDDSGDDDSVDDDSADDDDDLFDPLDHVGEAWTLAEGELTGTPELLALFQIEGEAQNFEVDLPEKSFEWVYWFYAEWDQGQSRAVWSVTLEPEESVELFCDQDDDNCDVLGRVFLQQEEWGDATLGYQAMVALAAPEVAGMDLYFISLFEDLNPAFAFIGYYLQDSSDVVLLVNAETGQIVPE